MPYHCVAYGCGKTAEDGVTLFKFPKDPEEFRKWEKQVQRTRTQWVATPNSHLCSEHFGREYFEPRPPTGSLKLRPGAAPTVFVRPHCSSCSGVGCSKCLPAIQRRGITVEPRERAVSVIMEKSLQRGRERVSVILRASNKPLGCLHSRSLLFTCLHRQNTMKRRPFSLMVLMEEATKSI